MGCCNDTGLRKGVITGAFLLASFLAPKTAMGFCFEHAGRYYNVSSELLSAIAWVESGFNPYAINRNRDGTYDYGLMQINSRWAAELGEGWRRIRGLKDPCYNVVVGAWVLSRCISRFGYTWDAVGCYHAGRPDGKEARMYIRKVQGFLTGGRQW